MDRNLISIKKTHRTLTFFMLLGLVAIATTSVVLYLPSLNNSNESHPSDHGLLRESEAVHFPLEITQFYKEFESEGDSD
ncbi:MAG: hypothetical protein ACRD32_09135, partial [Nitrososphaerales archaeon]